MGLKKEFIGALVYVKKLDRNILIEDKPEMFEDYKNLGLNIFDDSHSEEPSQHGNLNSKRKGNYK